MKWSTVPVPTKNEYIIRIDKYRIYFPAAVAKNKKYTTLLKATENPNTYAFEFSNTGTNQSVEVKENNTFYISKSYYKKINFPEGKYKAEKKDEKLIFQIP